MKKDWELEQELEDFRREMEWESSLEKTAKCDTCGMTDLECNMYPKGYGHKWRCAECELEEDWEVDID